MKWRTFLIGTGVGLLLGYSLKNNWSKAIISPDKALSLVKKTFKEKGAINGSWIYTIPQNFDHNDLTYTIYKVGISLTQNGIPEQFEIAVDAKTGTIIHLEKLTNL
ncbi:PepSY domain-containing protein [Bacillus sp. FJAT-47783]|uniref:PepSY domain-containing protein n=1 Tax=Bacillus sp. FJAT-47783 TaxID=2922712 RepID=UPI001FAC137B|nr:PepSY domain-containing protein [Bacillus sp. FJAT-47783]